MTVLSMATKGATVSEAKTPADWARLILSPPDDDECAACYDLVSLDDGCDPTPLCHTCAQEAAMVLAADLEASRAREARYRKALQRIAGQYITNDDLWMVARAALDEGGR